MKWNSDDHRYIKLPSANSSCQLVVWNHGEEKSYWQFVSLLNLSRWHLLEGWSRSWCFGQQQSVYFSIYGNAAGVNFQGQQVLQKQNETAKQYLVCPSIDDTASGDDYWITNNNSSVYSPRMKCLLHIAAVLEVLLRQYAEGSQQRNFYWITLPVLLRSFCTNSVGNHSTLVVRRRLILEVLLRVCLCRPTKNSFRFSSKYWTATFVSEDYKPNSLF